jgi:hypothetical protein
VSTPNGPGLEAVCESTCTNCGHAVVLLRSPLQTDAPTLWVHLPSFTQYCDLQATPVQLVDGPAEEEQR